MRSTDDEAPEWLIQSHLVKALKHTGEHVSLLQADREGGCIPIAVQVCSGQCSVAHCIPHYKSYDMSPEAPVAWKFRLYVMLSCFGTY